MLHQFSEKQLKIIAKLKPLIKDIAKRHLTAAAELIDAGRPEKAMFEAIAVEFVLQAKLDEYKGVPCATHHVKEWEKLMTSLEKLQAAEEEKAISPERVEAKRAEENSTPKNGKIILMPGTDV